MSDAPSASKRVSPRDTCKHCKKSFASRYTRKKHEESGVCTKGKPCAAPAGPSQPSRPRGSRPSQNSSDERKENAENADAVRRILVQRALAHPSVRNVDTIKHIASRGEMREVWSAIQKGISDEPYNWAANLWGIVRSSKADFENIHEILKRYKIPNENGSWGSIQSGHYIILSRGVVIVDNGNGNLKVTNLEHFVSEPLGYRMRFVLSDEHKKSMKTHLLYGEPERGMNIIRSGALSVYREEPLANKISKEDLARFEASVGELKKNIELVQKVGRRENNFNLTIARNGIEIGKIETESYVSETGRGDEVLASFRAPAQVPDTTGRGVVQYKPNMEMFDVFFQKYERPVDDEDAEDDKANGIPETDYVKVYALREFPDVELLKRMVTASVLLGAIDTEVPFAQKTIPVLVWYDKSKKQKAEGLTKIAGFKKDKQGNKDAEREVRSDILCIRLKYTIPENVLRFADIRKGGRGRSAKKYC